MSIPYRYKSRNSGSSDTAGAIYIYIHGKNGITFSIVCRGKSLGAAATEAELANGEKRLVEREQQKK